MNILNCAFSVVTTDHRFALHTEMLEFLKSKPVLRTVREARDLLTLRYTWGHRNGFAQFLREWAVDGNIQIHYSPVELKKNGYVTTPRLTEHVKATYPRRRKKQEVETRDATEPSSSTGIWPEKEEARRVEQVETPGGLAAPREEVEEKIEEDRLPPQRLPPLPRAPSQAIAKKDPPPAVSRFSQEVKSRAQACVLELLKDGPRTPKEVCRTPDLRDAVMDLEDAEKIIYVEKLWRLR